MKISKFSYFLFLGVLGFSTGKAMAAPEVSYGYLSGNNNSEIGCSFISTWYPASQSPTVVSSQTVAGQILGEGEYQICIRSVENAQATYSFAINGSYDSFIVDRVSPSVLVTRLVESFEFGSPAANNLVSVEATDENGVFSVQYSLQSNSAVLCESLNDYGSPIPASSSSMAVGTYVVCVKGTDNAGNVNFAKSMEIAVTGGQTEPISFVSLTSNRTGSKTGEGSVTYTATYSAPVYFTQPDIVITNGYLDTFSQVGGVFTFTINPGGEGNMTFSLSASSIKDLAGNAIPSNPQGFSGSMDFVFTDDLFFYEDSYGMRLNVKTDSCNAASNRAAPGFTNIRVEYDGGSHIIDSGLLQCFSHDTTPYFHLYLPAEAAWPQEGSPVTISYLNVSNSLLYSRIFANYGHARMLSLTATGDQGLLTYECSPSYRYLDDSVTQPSIIYPNVQTLTLGISAYSTSIDIDTVCDRNVPRTFSFTIDPLDEFTQADAWVSLYYANNAYPLSSIKVFDIIRGTQTVDFAGITGPDRSNVVVNVTAIDTAAYINQVKVSYQHYLLGSTDSPTGYDSIYSGALDVQTNLFTNGQYYKFAADGLFQNNMFANPLRAADVFFTIDAVWSAPFCSQAYTTEYPFEVIADRWNCELIFSASNVSSTDPVIDGELAYLSGAYFFSSNFTITLAEQSAPSYNCDQTTMSCINIPATSATFNAYDRVSVSYTDTNMNLVSFETWVTIADSNVINLAGGLPHYTEVVSGGKFTITVLESMTLGGAVIGQACGFSNLCYLTNGHLFFAEGDKIRVSYTNGLSGSPVTYETWVASVDSLGFYIAGPSPNSNAPGYNGRIKVEIIAKGTYGGVVFTNCSFLYSDTWSQNVTLCGNGTDYFSTNHLYSIAPVKVSGRNSFGTVVEYSTVVATAGLGYVELFGDDFSLQDFFPGSLITIERTGF